MYLVLRAVCVGVCWIGLTVFDIPWDIDLVSVGGGRRERNVWFSCRVEQCAQKNCCRNCKHQALKITLGLGSCWCLPKAPLWFRLSVGVVFRHGRSAADSWLWIPVGEGN